MANPLFNMMNNKNQNNIFVAFEKFMQQMQGLNSHDVLNQLIQQKGITQQQINELQNEAQQIMPQVKGLKNIFGFK